MKSKLQNCYPGIKEKERCSCGGNQMLLKDRTLRQFGCGAVAALDFVRYLHLYRDGCKTDLFTGIPDNPALTCTLYRLCVLRLCRSYVPILPHIATNGLFISAGINAYFRHYELPLQARWGVKQDKLWQEIDRMLSADLPVILGIGKPVKHFLHGHCLNLYRSKNGSFQPTGQVSGHFLTVLGLDKEWLYVASWGREFAINRQELMHYAHAESSQFLCNIVQVIPKF